MRRELFIVWIASVWYAGIAIIGLYGFAYWHLWTWIPMIAFNGLVLGLAYFFNVARKAIQNTSGTGFDQKHWPTDSERLTMIEKMQGVKARNS